MREYIADVNMGKKLYRQCRKNYKRYSYGIGIALVFLVVTLLLNVWLPSHTHSPEGITGSLLIGLGFEVPLLFGIALGYAVAVSGGREMFSRNGEKTTFTDEGFIVEYYPSAFETTEFECIESHMAFKAIKSVTYDERCARLSIMGDYEIKKYRTLQKHAERGNMVSYYVTSGLVYIYAYYPEFESVKKEFGL